MSATPNLTGEHLATLHQIVDTLASAKGRVGSHGDPAVIARIDVALHDVKCLMSDLQFARIAELENITVTRVSVSPERWDAAFDGRVSVGHSSIQCAVTCVRSARLRALQRDLPALAGVIASPDGCPLCADGNCPL